MVLRINLEGTLVITDPCYFINENDWDYVMEEGADYLNSLDDCKMIADDTGFGDWSCVVIDNDSKGILGHFAADAGMVCVTTLEEIERYNPDKVQHLKEIPWCCFILSNFNGLVEIMRDLENNRVVWTSGSHNLHSAQNYPLL